MIAPGNERAASRAREIEMRKITITKGRTDASRASAAAVAALALVLSGCAGGPELPVAASLGLPTSGQPITTGAIGSAEGKPGAQPQIAGDPAAAIQMARSLRAGGDRERAYRMLERAATKMPGDNALSLELGLAALELGHLDVAEKRLKRAASAGATDWRLHMGLATALAGKGRHDEAKAEFAKALALKPGHPSILNNMAMARSMAGDRAEAEQLLLKASAHPAAGPQVKQNLALMLALNGKLGEAERVVETSLPKASAPATVAYLRSVAKGATVPGLQPKQQPAQAQATQPPMAKTAAASAPKSWTPTVAVANEKR